MLPVQEFNAHELKTRNPQTGELLRNYWGYNPVSFSAVNGAYSSTGSRGQQTLEFKEMVRQMHLAGIEVIIDVVLNHTAENDELGPTISWRGIDNSVFYTLQKDKRQYLNAAGTGNTINANHPVVRAYILNVLLYWVTEMHVDGFRFDLASILGRDRDGSLLTNPPLLEQIAEDPILRDTKLIAEAWDAAGAYQVGSFSERRWAEWNGRYRDDVRRFWRGDDGMLGAFASRICGSEDIYAKSGKGPESSINFITCHDGFTLNDLVSFADKHNLANGEQNRDGTNDNFSANHGVEGPTEDPYIESLRRRQIRNFLATLLISRGVPMLQGGDEFRRTQGGNNNAYCQDNETSWYDWGCLQQHPEIHQFVKHMIALRQAHPILAREQFYADTDLTWFGPAQSPPNWQDPRAKAVACHIHDGATESIFLMFNAGNEPVTFHTPVAPDKGRWQSGYGHLPGRAHREHDRVARRFSAALRARAALERHPGGELACWQSYHLTNSPALYAYSTTAVRGIFSLGAGPAGTFPRLAPFNLLRRPLLSCFCKVRIMRSQRSGARRNGRLRISAGI